jgi:hypothetical protein
LLGDRALHAIAHLPSGALPTVCVSHRAAVGVGGKQQSVSITRGIHRNAFERVENQIVPRTRRRVTIVFPTSVEGSNKVCFILTSFPNNFVEGQKCVFGGRRRDEDEKNCKNTKQRSCTKGIHNDDGCCWSYAESEVSIQTLLNPLPQSNFFGKIK